MASRQINGSQPSPTKRAPAATPEARENRLISLAQDLAERQLEEGVASSQVITHYLKLGSTREELEREKIALESRLLEARVESIASAARIEELYSNAISAMRAYGGHEDSEPQEEVYPYEY